MEKVDEIIDLLINDKIFRKRFLDDRAKTLDEMNIDRESEKYKSLMKLNVTGLLVDPSRPMSIRIKPI